MEMELVAHGGVIVDYIQTVFDNLARHLEKKCLVWGHLVEYHFLNRRLTAPVINVGV